MKKISALLLAFAMLFVLASCNEKPVEVEFDTNPPETSAVDVRENRIKIAATADPMGLGFAKLSVDRDYAYDVTYYTNPQDAIDLFKSGKADVVSVSPDTAARLYNEIGGIEMLAINTYGITYVISADKELKTVDGLKGKTVYCPSDNAGVKAIFLKSLELGGVTDVDVQYKTANEIREEMIAGTMEYAVLPEYKSMDVVGRIAEITTSVDIGEFWEEKCGFSLAQGCVIAKKDFVEKNPEAIEEFLGFYEVSVNYLPKNQVNASLFLEENKFFENAELAKALIETCNPVFVSGAEMKELAKKNFDALISADAEILSGNVPADDFYYGA